MDLEQYFAGRVQKFKNKIIKFFNYEASDNKSMHKVQ